MSGPRNSNCTTPPWSSSSRREARLALRAYSGATVDELSRVVEQTGPIIGRLLSAMHRKRLRQFLAEAGQGN